MTLRGKVAVVTGAASGMGRVLCRELTDWQIHSLWFTVGYCIVGRPKVQSQ